MKLSFLLLAVLVGGLIPLQGAIDSRLGLITGQLRMSIAFDQFGCLGLRVKVMTP